MWMRWVPWRFVVRRLARSHGFLDPIHFLSMFQRFAQPAEVMEPIELLRAGVVLHARGLMNSRAIQHNLDWVWPYWVERQFNPADEAFVPRAFSLTHINLTHRNWTAVGLPGVDHYPLVDPAGALTPLDDGWTLDGWVIDDSGNLLAPSRSRGVRQRLELEPELRVITETQEEGRAVCTTAGMALEQGRPVAEVAIEGRCDTGGWLVVALRPYNPEGVSFVHKIGRAADGREWTVEGKPAVRFDVRMERHLFSNYREGDVAQKLRELRTDSEAEKVTCDVGMATAAALFRLEPSKPRTVTVATRIEVTEDPEIAPDATPPALWREAMEGMCRLRVPDQRIQFLWDAAIRTVVLHSPGDVYPGPYTYRRFWFRDAALILHAHVVTGMTRLAERAIERFFPRQTALGYFHSQEGEWDSNGQVLWILHKFLEATGREMPEHWAGHVEKGANWMGRKRQADGDGPHDGLMPAGFSAEHLGPNDYYYWDDLWSVGGLRGAAAMFDGRDAGLAAQWRAEADRFVAAIERTLERAESRLGTAAMPAAPLRRLDSGAIGSIVAGYPLQLWEPTDKRLLASANWMIDECFVKGGFFQDMIHSGVNAYLTLHLAQILLRAGDGRHWDLIEAVAELASPTGQWPEAIHPRTGGGCMGDGQHVWAAAEWLVMLRNCFAREEGETLVVAGGLPAKWLEPGAGDAPIELGPTRTRWGAVMVKVTPGDGAGRKPRVQVQGDWRGKAPEVVSPLDIDGI